MGYSTMNGRNKVTMPASLRKLVGAKAGTVFVWTLLPDGTGASLRLKEHPDRTLEDHLAERERRRREPCKSGK